MLEDSFVPALRAYMGAPQSVKSTIGWLYGRLPRRIRFGNDYPQWLRTAQLREPAVLARDSTERLARTLSTALEAVPAYRPFRHLLSRLDDPLAVLDELPIIDKTDIKRDWMAHVSTRLSARHRLETFTGGSTANPMRFYLQRHVSRVREYAFMDDFHARVGMQDDSRVLALRGRTVPSARAGGALWMHEPIKNQLILSSDHLKPDHMPRYIAAIRCWRPEYIQAFPSAMYPLAKWLALHPAPDITNAIRGVMLYSETTHPHQLQLFRQVFDRGPVLMHYGHSERCVMAATMPEDDRYFFWPQYGHLELIDDQGRQVTTPGKSGEIVCTSFDNEVMPFVRYRTGDRGVLGNDDRSPLPGFPVLDRIEGRLQEMVQCADGRLISITTLGAAHFNELASVMAIQFEQHRPGELVLNVETATSLTPAARRSIEQAVEEKTQGGCTVKVQEVGAIPRTQAGKQKMLLQHLCLQEEAGNASSDARPFATVDHQPWVVAAAAVGSGAHARAVTSVQWEVVRRKAEYLTRHLARRAFLAKRRAARLISAESDDLDRIRSRQAHLLAHTLRWAPRSIPAYRNLGPVPEGEATFDFLRNKVAVITKESLLSGRDTLYPNGGHRRAWWLAGRTSGTSGSPLEVFRSLDSAIWEEAFHLQTWAWCGLAVGEPQAVLRGDLVTLTSANADRLALWDPWGRQLFLATPRLNLQTVGGFVSACIEHRCVALRAYPSAAFQFARMVQMAGLELRFRVVVTGSEPLYEVQRETIESAFHCKVMDFYGMAERVAYAAQCAHGHLHLNPEYSFVEIVDDDNQQTDDFGFIVGTTFWNDAMPLLRYRLSDKARWVAGACSCGRTYPRIELASGKLEDQLFDGRGFPVSASVITFAFKGVEGIEKTQVAQVGPEDWEIRIVAGSRYDSTIGQQIVGNLRAYVSSHVRYAVRLVDDIPTLPSGKFKWVSQEWKSR